MAKAIKKQTKMNQNQPEHNENEMNTIEEVEKSKLPEDESIHSEVEETGEINEKMEEPENTIQEPTLDEKYEQLNDKYLRLSAEYDNYRKRTLKERMELIKNAGEDILIGFLPAFDNIERALKSTENAKDLEAVKQGVNLIHKSLSDFLKDRGITEINAIGEVFNTDLHEAITKIPASEEGLKGKVVDVIEKGYMLKDKVLRYAKVVVGE